MRKKGHWQGVFLIVVLANLAACTPESGRKKKSDISISGVVSDSLVLDSLVLQFNAHILGSKPEPRFTIDWQRSFNGRTVIVSAEIIDIIAEDGPVLLASSVDDLFMWLYSSSFLKYSSRQQWKGSFRISDTTLIQQLRSNETEYSFLVVHVDSVSNPEWDHYVDTLDFGKARVTRLLHGSLAAVRPITGRDPLAYNPYEDR